MFEEALNSHSAMQFAICKGAKTDWYQLIKAEAYQSRSLEKPILGRGTNKRMVQRMKGRSFPSTTLHLNSSVSCGESPFCRLSASVRLRTRRKHINKAVLSLKSNPLAISKR